MPGFIKPKSVIRPIWVKSILALIGIIPRISYKRTYIDTTYYIYIRGSYIYFFLRSVRNLWITFPFGININTKTIGLVIEELALIFCQGVFL